MTDAAGTRWLLRRSQRQPIHKCSMFYLLITGLSLIFTLGNIAGGATYYLDAVNGSDSNPGSSEQPWKTLNRAYTWYTGEGPKVQEGDTVYFRNGNYGTFRENTDDGSGRLFYRNDWITYKAAAGHTPTLYHIDISNSDKWAPIEHGRSYLKFEGFNIQHAVGCNFTSYFEIRDCNVTTAPYELEGYYAPYVSPSSHCISVKTSHYVTIENNIIHQAYRGIGLVDGCNNATIRGNEIYYLSEDGIVTGTTTNLTIENNTIYNHNKYRHWIPAIGTINGTFIAGETLVLQGTEAQGLYDHTASGKVFFWQTSQTTILAKWLEDKSRILVGQSSGATLTNISDVDPDHSDSITTTGGTNTILRNNKLLRSIGGGLDGQALKPATSTNYRMYNNLIVAHVGIIGPQHTDQFYMYNNTIYVPAGDETGHSMELYYGESTNTVITEMYNNIISRYKQRSDQEPYYVRVISHGNNIFGNNPNPIGGPAYPFTVNSTEVVNCNIASLFVDAANGDFRLKERSIARDFGNSAYAPATDIAGNRRDSLPDAGCYEYNNQGPVLQSIGDKAVNEGTLLTFTLSAGDPDGGAITYSAQNLPSGATLSGATFSWTPSYAQAGTYQVTFIASDGPAQDSETITISVVNVNRPPVLAPIGDKPVGEGATLSFTASASDADGDPVTYSVQNLPSGAAFAGQTFTWAPGYNQAGTYQVTFTVSDGQAQDAETITIAVQNVNRAPVLSTVGDQSVFATDLLTFSVQAADADGDRIQYSAQGLPSGATFTNQNLSWTPSPSQAGNYQVTFTASDGQSRDSEAVAITAYAEDKSPPTVTNCVPAPDSIQVLLNTVIYMHIIDTGKGVDANSVSIKVNNGTVYSGNTTHYSSQTGNCRRTGTKADYAFTYQQNENFNFEQEFTVTVNATDLGGNAMPEYRFSFWTEMRSFGKNKRVSLGLDNLGNAAPATVRDSTGNIWVVWHAGPAGSRDVYLAMLAEGASSFTGSIQLTADSADQCDPAVAVAGSDKLYVVWQDNRRGNWDVYVSTSVDGVSWSAERLVTDSNDNQINPAIAIDGSSPSRAYVVWQDDRGGNQDIYVASSSDGFATKAISQITANVSDQIDPVVAVDSANTVYVVWTDKRNSSNDIYGAASNSGPWTNVPIVNKAGNQSSPAIAAETAGSILHLLWADDGSGNSDIYHAATNGLPSSPLVGSSIIDDSSGAGQLEPAIAVTGSTGDNLQVFACWQDRRNVAGASGDTDLYFVEVSSDGRTNVFVGDDSINSNQSQPAISVDVHGQPYLVWNDSRSANPQIYYAGSTYLNPEPVAWQLASPSSTAIVGTDPANMTSADDVSVTVPAGACSCDIRIAISEIKNPQGFTVPCLAAYDFGPSGIRFNQPVTITIPYAVPASQGSVTPYWYNSLSGALTQQGIIDIKDVVISPTLHALSFKTTHFTPFYIVEGTVGETSGSGGGGGCSVSAAGNGSIVEFLLPYMVLAAVMMILKRHDTRERKAREVTRRQC